MSERKSLAELDYLCHAAKQMYDTGTLWRHNASSGIYKITGHSAREHDGVVVIHYKPVRDTDNMVLGYVSPERPSRDHETGEIVYDHVSFNRPVTEWEEVTRMTEDGDVAHKPRFTRVERFHQYRDYRGQPPKKGW